MKRQMKMTTAKKPQKKFLGGAMKKLMPKISEMVKKNTETVKAASPAASEALNAKPQELTRDGVMRPKSPVKVRARAVRGLGRALRGRGKKDDLSKAGGMMGMKKGGAVMKDKMGRAMKKTTADAKGRAMKKGK